MIDSVKENIPYIELNNRNNGPLISALNSSEIVIPQAQKMELEGLEDLINLITSVSSNDCSLYHYSLDDTHIYFVYVIIHDFYTYRGIPVLIYTTSEIEPDLYLKYQPNHNHEITMTDKFLDASAIYIKIIKVKKLPECLEI